MKRVRTILPLIAVILFLGSCAQYQKRLAHKRLEKREAKTNYHLKTAQKLIKHKSSERATNQKKALKKNEIQNRMEAEKAAANSTNKSTSPKSYGYDRSFNFY